MMVDCAYVLHISAVVKVMNCVIMVTFLDFLCKYIYIRMFHHVLYEFYRKIVGLQNS
jgi:hypothetical protein